jgi:Xaa-Pro aminopeptidase
LALVTKNGVENMSVFVPTQLKDIERAMKKKGLIQFRPAKSLPLNK